MRADKFTWFDDSPDVGERCICSLCGKPIRNGVPIRIFSEGKKREARFHINCYNTVSAVALYERDEDYPGADHD